MQHRPSTSLKLPCLFVGVGHLILIGLSLYERIWELVKLEEPFQLQDYSFIIISYLAQLSAVFLLIFGSITGNPYYIIPWLVCTCPLFISATVYALLFAQEETSQILLNFVIVGVIWSTWYIAIKFHWENKRKAQLLRFKTYVN